LDQEHRREFTPAQLVPDIRLRVHNPDCRQLLDELSVGHVAALQLALEQSFDFRFPFRVSHECISCDGKAIIYDTFAIDNSAAMPLYAMH
jgi:hypothetical protein